MEQNGISKLDLKRLNRTEILRLITKNGPISRIDISYNLKLTRAAVTIITNEMINQGIIYEKGEEQTKQKATRGRKKILLDVCENYKFSFGVVLDRKKLSIGLANIKGQTLQKEVVVLNNNNIESILALVTDKVNHILSQNCLTQKEILGVGICISDNALPLFEAVDEWKTEQTKESILTKKEKAIDLVKQIMQKNFTIPVLVEGTTESLAIAEMTFNDKVHNYSENIVFVRYGYDIDAAIMIDNNIYKGSNNNSSWFSHLVVDTGGEHCDCGKRGCCITKMSIKKMINNIKMLYLKGQTPRLFEKTEGDLSRIDFSVENFKNLAEDESIRKLFKQAHKYLIAALDNISIVLDPDKIVIFGYAFEKIWTLTQLEEVILEDSAVYGSEKVKKIPENYANLMDKIMLSAISDNNIHLAGNGLCVKILFINTGGGCL